MFRSYPLVSRLLVFALLPLFAATWGGIIYLRSGLPANVGGVHAQQSVGTFEIRRDEDGVAFITAQSDEAAFFALGVAHAQDRMWQLEMQRRMARGTLSEVLGRSTMRQDAWMRTLGIYESASSAWMHLSRDARLSLTSYAAGVNAWLQTNPVLPPEFAAFGVEPEPWTEIDSLAWVKVLALNLGGNMWSELSRFVSLDYLDERQRRELLGAPVLDQQLAKFHDSAGSSGLGDLLSLGRQLQDQGKIGGRFVGSNAWVISGALADSRASIMANDVHLALQIPSPWYVASLKGDVLEVAGMTLVGVPVVIFGRNRHVAWGGTNLMADVQDLYFEETDPHDPRRYRAGRTWKQFETRTELIRARPDFPASLRTPVQPLKMRVRKTGHGPVVSDAMDGIDQVIALQWTALDVDDRSYESFFRVSYARDWRSFKESFRNYVAPALNLVYADDGGNIGSFAVGRIPMRARGTGWLPVPGWTDEYRWSGYVPFENWRDEYNPQRGYIVAANDAAVADGYPFFISADWAAPTRAQRIAQLIGEGAAAGDVLEPEQSIRMQADTVDLGAARLGRILSRTPVSSAEHRQALEYVGSWNGDMSRDSPAAAIFAVWSRNLRSELFGAALRGYDTRSQRASSLQEVINNTTDEQVAQALANGATWCGAGSASSARACDDVLRRSLDRALRQLERLRGRTMGSWRWGDLQTTVYAHLPFSEVKVLSALFERRIANGGSPNTINVAAANFKEDIGFEQVAGASFRQIIKIGGSRPQHLYMNSTGQSGNVLSAHYADMIEAFRDVQYRRLIADMDREREAPDLESDASERP